MSEGARRRNKLSNLCNTAVDATVKPLVFANFLAPNMTATYAFVAAAIGQRLGVATTYFEGTDVGQLLDGSVDVAFLCGLPYIRLCQERPGAVRPLAAPVIDEPRYQDRPVYFSDVIVRRDSPYRSFADLRGKSWAYSREDSFSGCLLVHYQLSQMGEHEAFFGQVSYSGWHQESIRLVLAGELEASAIDSHVLGVECLQDPDLTQKLRVVASFGPSTIPPVVAGAGVNDEMHARIRHAFCEIGTDSHSRKALARGLIRRFNAIDDRAYDDIRQKMAVVDNSVRPGTEFAGRGA
jgi:phosphonate transport system substrate-binding protein